MRLVNFFVLLCLVGSTQASMAVVPQKSSQIETDENIHLNLLVPRELLTGQEFNQNALDSVNKANEAVSKKLDLARHCIDCDTYATGNEPSFEMMFGNGGSTMINGHKAPQHWDLSSRISKSIGNNCFRADAGLLNEGHPELTETNPKTGKEHSEIHHRDGFFIQLTCRKEILHRLYAEVSAGPYYTMDTTTPVGKTEQDQKGLAILATAALTYYIGNDGWHARIECDAVRETNILTKGPNSSLCMAGLGKDFALPSKFASQAIGSDVDMSGFAIAAGVATFKTNHGSTRGSHGEEIEISKEIGNSFQARLGLMVTGSDGSINNDRGVTFDLDYMIPIGREGRTALYTGAGVYLARNYETNQTDKDISLTFLGIQHRFKNNMFVRVDYNRLAKTNDAEVGKRQGDADAVRAEFGYQWK